MSPTLQADSLPAKSLGKPIFTSRSRQIRISLKEKRNLLLLHIKHFQLLLCFVFPALNCYFIPFAYFSFRIFNLQVLSHHKDITISVLGKENFCFIIFPGIKEMSLDLEGCQTKEAFLHCIVSGYVWAIGNFLP